MEASNESQPQGRLQLHRRSSLEFKISEELFPFNRRRLMVLSVIRSSTLALVASLFFGYAWLISIGVGSSFLTFSLIDSAQDTLNSFQEDQNTFQGVFDQLKLETQLARQDLEISRSTCRIEFSPFLDSGFYPFDDKFFD